MSDPLPATPIWFASVSDSWKAYESFRGVLNATLRLRQLERLKEARHIEFICRSYGPGVVKLWARQSQES